MIVFSIFFVNFVYHVILLCVYFSKEIAKDGVDVVEEAVEESEVDSEHSGFIFLLFLLYIVLGIWVF